MPGRGSAGLCACQAGIHKAGYNPSPPGSPLEDDYIWFLATKTDCTKLTTHMCPVATRRGCVTFKLHMKVLCHSRQSPDLHFYKRSWNRVGRVLRTVTGRAGRQRAPSMRKEGGHFSFSSSGSQKKTCVVNVTKEADDLLPKQSGTHSKS